MQYLNKRTWIVWKENFMLILHEKNPKPSCQKHALADLNCQGSKYLKIGTCPASQKLLAYMGKKLIFTRNIKIFNCPAAWGTRKYERTSAIFEPWLPLQNDISPGVRWCNVVFTLDRCYKYTLTYAKQSNNGRISSVQRLEVGRSWRL